MWLKGIPNTPEHSEVNQVLPTLREKLSSVPRRKGKMIKRGICRNIGKNRKRSKKKSVDSQGPTVVCTPMFLEIGKSQMTEISDNEIFFKLPVPPVKEGGQKTLTPASPRVKRLRKRKSELWS